MRKKVAYIYVNDDTYLALKALADHFGVSIQHICSKELSDIAPHIRNYLDNLEK